MNDSGSSHEMPYGEENDEKGKFHVNSPIILLKMIHN